MKRFAFVMVISLLLTGIKVQANCNTCEEEVKKEGMVPHPLTYASDTRYPQTILYDVVMNFLEEPNEKHKKVLILGYDGFREDALIHLLAMDQSAVTSVMMEGGLYHSYAGADGKQETSTAPGWLSILSGTWAYTLGVDDNEGQKPYETRTFLDEAISLGYPATFIASWSPHFDVTYQADIASTAKKALYQQMEDDEATLAQLHHELLDSSIHAYDVVFATLEFSDHIGHTLGYGNDMPAYVDASLQADQEAFALLETIQKRTTYQEEDWLIILTSDHGGIGNGHGGQSAEEVNTWFAMNKSLQPN